MSGTLRLVLGDQLTSAISSLSDLDPSRDLVVMAEVGAEATYVRHHKKKIAFLFSAMRHHAEALRERQIDVAYTRIGDRGNAGSLVGEVERRLDQRSFARVVVTEPGEWRLMAEMRGWEGRLGVPVEIRSDTRFIASHADFAAWADGRRELRMEFFYREMRRKTGLLMRADGEPEGGRWNFDTENRKALPKDRRLPDRLAVEPDAITREVMAEVESRFGDHFGALEPFRFAVTASGAERARDAFLADCLADFGDYQDAMAVGQPWLYHSVLSMYLNAGLLDPLDLCRRAEAAYYEGKAPLNAVEGFIRQIIGWREYVRGIYWLKMPDYAQTNALAAHRPLPDFFWTGDTDMRCLAEAIGETKANAYAHHIQRLMVTGNFALIAGIDPKAVNEWYMIVYADAYEWVELPNTHGMALYADGGLLASKPYAASGQYINRQSDYCSSCRYDVKKKQGADACPFNYLYWNFLMDHEARFASNQRMGMILGTLKKMDTTRRAEIRSDAKRFFAEIGVG